LEYEVIQGGLSFSRFSEIFWIDASSESSIELGLMQIAQANNVSPEGNHSAGSALQWISQKTKWLMVYDSADGHYPVVEKFLPPGNEGNILITSRNPEVRRITLNKNSVEVLDMTDEEACALLLEAAMLDDTSDQISGMVSKLVSRLGKIPLALDQAGAYMQSCGCSIDDYLELYSKHKDELLSSGRFKGASGYGTSTYGTWDISMYQIEHMAANGIEEETLAAQNAMGLLKIFAFLDHANIPEELFKNAADNYMNVDVDEASENSLLLSVKLLNHQTLFLNGEGIWERMQFLAGAQVLLSFSLIKTHNQTYSMHLLVHAWSRNMIPKGEVMDVCHKARAILSNSVVHDHQIYNYAYCRLIAPHIRSNYLHASELGLKQTYYDDEHEIFALVFDHAGSWNEAEKLLLVSVKERSAQLGLTHPATLNSMSQLAFTYDRLGRLNEAEKLNVDVMNVRKAIFGLDHPDTLLSMHNLAWTYNIQRRLSEAEKLGLDVVDARKSKLGLDHPETLISMTNLASTYREQGRFNEAEKLEVYVINVRKAKLGLDHPDTVLSMHNLACTYNSQRRLSEAEKLGLDVVDARKAKLGLDHPDTLTSMANLGVTYNMQGRFNEAEKLEVDVVDTRKAKLGLDHPDTLLSMQNLACTYREQGRFNEAEKLLVDVIDARKAKFELNHPDTLLSMANLASTYNAQGRLNEAESLLSLAVKSMEQVLGAEHPTTCHFMEQYKEILSKLMDSNQSQQNVLLVCRILLIGFLQHFI
jgi:hypothetical protein